jgi:insulysin
MYKWSVTLGEHMKQTALLTILFLTSSIYAEPYTLIEDKAKIQILSPELKDQKKLKIRLDNGIEALLISDPKTEESGILVMVNVGSLSDPVDYPGLAHFLEHMLFLGTTKYPSESEYFKYISDHGGNLEAFTTPSSTCFFFSVNNDAFLGALDRFSYFFKEPLFNPTGVDREMQAVNQEYEKNVENDLIRQYYVHKELSNSSHPLHAFNMGNIQSLKKVTQDILKTWYKEHYSANLMKIVVQSNLPLNDLRDKVVESFKDVPNSNKSVLTLTSPFITPEYKAKFVYIEPIQDTQKLTMIWELPSKFAALNVSQPENIVCHILGHEGEKSLLAELKKQKLAESLGCGAMRYNKDLSEMYLEVGLTENGLKNVDLVITLVYQTIQRIKEKGIEETLFQEIQKMAKIEYQFQNKEQPHNFYQKHAYMLPNESMDTYPEVTLIPQKYDPNAIQEYLSYLTPAQAQYFILAPSSKTLITPDKQEQWIGARYSVKAVPTQWIEKWSAISTSPSIDIPDPNNFIPTKVELVSEVAKKSEKRIPIPLAIISNDQANIYFAQDTLFKIPKVNWIFTIRTPAIAMNDSTKIVMGDLYSKFIDDVLNKLSYPAKVAGLEYSIKRAKNGITLEIGGYSQNSEVLFHEILESIKKLEISNDKFNLYKESLLRKYRNFANESPLDQAVEIFKSVLYENYVKEAEKATVLKDLTYQNFTEWYKTLYSKTFIEGILYGNMTSSDAANVAQEIVSSFKGSPYLKNEHFEEKVLVIPQDVGPMYLENYTKAAGNAVLLAIEDPTFTFKERATQQILMTAIKEPFFGTLRTKQQTGYLVHSIDQEVERKLFNLFLVQSSTHDTRDLLARFEEFIESYLQELGKKELSEEQFDKIKKSLKINLEENPKNITEMANTLNELAFKYDGDFDWISKRIQALDNLTYEEFIQTANGLLGKSNKRRLAILLHGVLPEENLFMYNKARSWTSLRKMYEYISRDKAQ